jgi:hypothetical protein
MESMKKVAGWPLTAAAVLALVLLALAVWRQGWSDKELAAASSPRGPELKRQLEQQRLDSAAALTAYRPNVAGNLDDLDAAAEPPLQQLPGVVQADLLDAAKAITPAAAVGTKQRVSPGHHELVS